MIRQWSNDLKHQQQYRVVLFRIGSTGPGFVSGTMGKLGRAWYRCMGVHGIGAWGCMASVHGAGWVGAGVVYYMVRHYTILLLPLLKMYAK